MKVLVAGGGIGGLTAALSLQKAGIEVTVHEAAPEILPLGAGINILPHAAKELIGLGLEAEIDKSAIRTAAMSYYTAAGALAISQPCGLRAGYKWPQWSVGRGALHIILLEAFKRRAGADKVITDSALSDFTQDARKVTAHFEHRRAGGFSEVEGDILVGADGLHSTTRRKLYPDEGKPLYSGMALYRGAVEAAQFLDGKTMVIIGDNRLRLVAYPISGALLKRGNGRSLINWIGALSMAEREAPSEDWLNFSQQQKLQPKYSNWVFDWLDAPRLLSATQEIYEFPVYDRNPLERWTFGRATLLGDAAHPLIPVSSSGAAQAIIDGRALAFALATQGDPVAGLRAYEADRLAKANEVVRASRQNGPDEVLEIVKRRCPEGANDIHKYAPLAELQAVIDEFKERAGFGVETLNALPSYEIND